MAEASSSSGKAYQNASTYLFVPRSFGGTTALTDDVNTPGAYFRLGGFSDIENAAGPTTANPAGDLASFYPRQHIADQGNAEAVAKAAGAAADPRGIMLACSGRLLIRSAEKTYLHSTGDIHIDTQATLKAKAEGAIEITSGDKITITSGDQKNITITAGGGTGNVTLEAAENTKRVNGKDYEYVNEDTFSYFQANAYTYRLGGSVDVALGGAFAFWMGTKLSISTSVEMQISLSAMIGITLYKLDMATFAAEFTMNKVDLKETQFSAGALFASSKVVQANVAAAETAAAAVRAANAQIVSDVAAIKSGMTTLTSEVGGIDVRVRTLEVHP